MGCGRSTLGSDSPKKNKRNGSECDEECDEDGIVGGNRKQQLSHKLVPFGAGGPLLAQAKISESQQDFFMMLDEKIENGPDYDSETEEHERRRRQLEYAQQWTAVNTMPLPPAPPSPPRLLDDDTCGSGDITEEDEDDDDEPGEPGRIPDEAVREQYMFMGNVYTLTHVRTHDHKVEPKVDVVVTAPSIDEPDLTETEFSHKLNGSAVPEEMDENLAEDEEDEMDADGKARRPSKPSSRPASLILKSVFPPDTVCE